MNFYCRQIHKVFGDALTEFRRQYGTLSVPFWRLGLHELASIDSGCLRDELNEALTSDTFNDSHVAPFLVFIQTQAAGHSYHLWDETVIPLLAGTGTDSRNLRSPVSSQTSGS